MWCNLPYFFPPFVCPAEGGAPNLPNGAYFSRNKNCVRRNARHSFYKHNHIIEVTYVSLRWNYPNQVRGLKRHSLLSACFCKLPIFSVTVHFLYSCEQLHFIFLYILARLYLECKRNSSGKSLLTSQPHPAHPEALMPTAADALIRLRKAGSALSSPHRFFLQSQA